VRPSGNRRVSAIPAASTKASEGEIMKRLLLALSILAALAIILGVFSVRADTEPKKTESATVRFTEKVKLLNVILKGEYTFVHDDAKMALGEDCTYVYDRAGKLVVSFHCIPVERKKATSFRIVTSRVTNDLIELSEYQFAGDTEAHQVP
jgi:hypothetical protein